MPSAFDDMDPQLRIGYLIASFVQQTLSAEEHEELDDWVNEAPEHTRLFEELTDPAAAGTVQDWFAHPQRLLSRAAAQRYLASSLRRRPAQGLRRLNAWKPYLAAAAIAGALLLGLHDYTTKTKATAQAFAHAKNGGPADEPVPEKYAGPIVSAGGDTLSTDGSEGSRPALNGKGGSGEGEYNTLITPSGAQYQLTLSDGTKVWLNAASSLRYPIAFTGAARTVSLQGEAYFEVARSAAKPFLVQAGATTIQVAGTRINIDAYGDNGTVNTTLLQGSVLVQCGGSAQRLHPGQQARSNTSALAIATADTSQAIAWKNGYFLFRNTPVNDLLAQLARWYGVTVEARTLPAGHYHATLPRTASLDRVLAVLAGTGNLHIRHEGNQLIVEP